MKTLFAALAAIPFGSAWAHAGHDMGTASHWHATDAVGLAIGLAAVALVLWSAGGK